MARQIEEKVAKEGWSVAVLEARTIVTLPEKCALVPPPTPGPPAHLVPVAMLGYSWRAAGLPYPTLPTPSFGASAPVGNQALYLQTRFLRVVHPISLGATSDLHQLMSCAPACALAVSRM